mmetsp:Transcript_15928/g.43701  ORF Transcript_15928/g.43701 Transcript_15928/m.43701 type:complete len:709 (-) Transcript_15928:112-2238(-)
MLRFFRECDLFRKLPQEHREAKSPESLPERVLQVLASFAILAMVLNETWKFTITERKQRFDLDMSESAAATAPRKVRVMFDVTVRDFPCIDLSLDYQDVMGTRAVDVKTTVFKQRLHKNGSAVGESLQNDPKTSVGGGPSNPVLGRNASGNSTCGSCYGALAPGECCNTCSDVLYAYRLKRWALPRIEDVSQCQNDGNSPTAYQPPQIIHLRDYSSDDFIPKFTKVGSELASSGSEARVSTPFKFNFTFEPLKPVNWNITAKGSGVTSYGLQPLTLNFSSSSSRGAGDDYDIGSLQSFKGGPSPSPPPVENAWPNCLWRNLIIHGWNEGEALMIDLTPYGAKEGCWDDECKETDKFSCDTLERCSVVCNQVQSCFFWTWGVEDGVRMCWLREGRSGREKRFGFASGHRLCASPELLRNLSNASVDDQTRLMLEDGANHSKKGKASRSKSAEAIASAPSENAGARPATGSGENAPELTARRLSSLYDDSGFPRPRRSFMDEDVDWSLGSFSSIHMPVFGYDKQERERRKAQQGESCRVHGYFDMNKVPGNFHIGTHGIAAPSYLTSFGYSRDSQPLQNMQHTINRLAFVEIEHNETFNDTQPLDGFESPKAFTFQYYITLSPATQLEIDGSRMDGYQFRAGSFVTNELIGPAVFFRLDMDPIRVTYYTKSMAWSKFLVNVCAIIGGCIALCSMLLQFLENFMVAISDLD